MRSILRKIVILALSMSRVACSSATAGTDPAASDPAASDDAAKFVGTFRYEDGARVTVTCGTSFDIKLSGTSIWSEPAPGDLQIDTGSRGCVWHYSVSGNVAHPKANQTCRVGGQGGAMVTLDVASTSTISDDGTTIVEHTSGSYGQDCTTLAEGTFRRVE